MHICGDMILLPHCIFYMYVYVGLCAAHVKHMYTKKLFNGICVYIPGVVITRTCFPFMLKHSCMYMYMYSCHACWDVHTCTCIFCYFFFLFSCTCTCTFTVLTLELLYTYMCVWCLFYGNSVEWIFQVFFQILYALTSQIMNRSLKSFYVFPQIPFFVIKPLSGIKQDFS